MEVANGPAIKDGTDYCDVYCNGQCIKNKKATPQNRNEYYIAIFKKS